MSEDISPTWIVLLESIFRIIQVFFLIFAMSQESIMVRFSMSVSDHIIFFKLPISCPKYIFRESEFSRVFHLSVRSICIFRQLPTDVSR
jgi:hypothetical protein